MDEIMKNVSHLAGTINRIAEALANSIGTQQGQENMRSTLQNLAEVTQALNETVRENREPIRRHPESGRLHHGERRAGGRSRFSRTPDVVTEEVRELLSKNDTGKTAQRARYARSSTR